MAQDEWRITTAFSGLKDASKLERHLTEDGAVAAAGGSLSAPGMDLYAYGASREAVERIVGAIRAGLVTLALKPTGVAIDKWVPEESRWVDPDDPDRRTDRGGDSGWMSGLIQGLIEGPW